MKKKITTRLAVAVAALLSMFMLSSRMSAQSTCGTYVVNNNLGCSITIAYTRSCNLGTCGFGSNITINAGASFNIGASCGSCAPGTCDIKVTLTAIGGLALTPAPSVTAANTSATFPTSYCAGSSGSLGWTATATNVN